MYEYEIECIECGWVGFKEDLLPEEPEEDEDLKEVRCCPECFKADGIVDF